ncbi:hypothetical protein [Streptomyces sp. NBC_00448]|uniref:hypothetical protein n=1 Tax=Streptomyces sp. NBC_00448 TaxID=2903652 RepID=UPI002E225A02
MRRTTTRRLTVGVLLDEDLRVPRVWALEAACAELAARPLDVTLAELEAVLAAPVTCEAGRRLHLLVSALYHHAGASLPLTEQLRARIQAAQTTTDKE